MWRISGLFLLFVSAPLAGLVLALYLHLAGWATALAIPLENLQPGLGAVNTEIENVVDNIGLIRLSVEEQEREYQEQLRILQELAEKSGQQKDLSDDVYEEWILAKLGPPIKTHESKRVQIKVFTLKELGYRGYIAKVKLYDPKSVKVVLGNDRLGQSETTSAAVARIGAILGINGGGFYHSTLQGEQAILPIGNTMIAGKLIGSFAPSHNDLFFAGFDRQGDLVGDIVHQQEQLQALNPYQGVSFVPMLIRGRKPLTIPAKWRNQKQPRTVLGEYANGDLIVIVVDGRQSDWSSGVTLEHLQIKMLELGVIEAYNLDGGGSSSFVYNGQILNRPSDGKERPVATNIVIMP